MIEAKAWRTFAGKPALVLTSTPLAEPPPEAVAIPADFPTLRAVLRDRGARAAWLVGGARSLAGALAAGALDRLHLFTMPVILGGGTLLFADGPARPATLVKSRTWGSGAVESVYDFTERFWP